MLGRLTKLCGALIFFAGSTQFCLADDHKAIVPDLIQASVLNLPDEATLIRLEADSEAKLELSTEQAITFQRSGNHLTAMLITDENTEPTILIDREAVTTSERAIEIRLTDANFDGIRDLLVETSIGYGGVNVFFDLLLGTESGFESVPVQTDLSNPEIDPVLKQIRTSTRSGPTWYLGVYEIEEERPFLHMTTTAAGDGIEYVRFMTSDGALEREMITDALADDPTDWKPIRLTLPKGALFPLRKDANTASEATDALPEDSDVLLLRLSEDKYFTLVEHAKTGVSGWLKTEWLPMPEGLRF